MEPQIRFCTSADGTRIAYSTLGEGPPLVHPTGWAGVECESNHPEMEAYRGTISQRRLFVEFDRRGIGASQREVSDLSLEAQVGDLAAVVDHLRLERFDLFGHSDADPAAIAYASQHPERVSRLVLWSPYPWGKEIGRPEAVAAMVEMIRANWGLARRAIADVMYPSGPLELQRWVEHCLRQALSPEVAAEYIRFRYSVDVRPYLPQVKAPTLVLHRRANRNVPVSAGRAVATLIPDARFVALEGDVDDWWYGHEQYFPLMFEFLDEGRVQAPSAQQAQGSFRTILFTDIEGSTALTQRLGDAKAREVLREHERIVREELKSHGGAEVKTMGDGFMASFGSATRALECAVAIQRAFAARNASLPAHPEALEARPERSRRGRAEPQPSAHGSRASPRADRGVSASSAGETIRVRIGLNAGEPIAEDDPDGRGDLFGTAVIRAARIATLGQGGEILVANVVRELAEGKGFLFGDRGEVALRGFDDPVRLFEVRWQGED